MKQNLHLLFNPHSGAGKKAGTLDKIRSYLDPHFTMRIHISKSRAEARSITESICSSSDTPCIAVAGGDGTISDVLNGCDLTKTTLGIIPVGTVNIVARELGIPLDIERACKVIRQGTRTTIDVTTANNRRFIFGVGVGFDAKIVHNVTLEKKLKFGKMSYALETFNTVKSFQPFAAKIRVDDTVIHDGPVFNVIIGKSKLYAGKYTLFPEASLDNGVIDAALFTHPGKLRFMTGCAKFFLKLRDSHISLIRGKKIEVLTGEKIPMQIDGDAEGFSPVAFQIDAQKLSLFAPHAC